VLPFPSALLLTAPAVVVGGGPTSGVLVNRSSTDSRAGGFFQFNHEVYDPGGWHDNAVNPSRLTVPSGVSLVRAIACCDWNFAQLTGIYKNGSLYAGGPRFQTSAADQKTSLASGITAVSAGDYLEVGGVNGVGTDLISSSYTWFHVEELPSTLKYALVQKSAAQALSTTESALTWNTEIADTDSWHDNVINNSRLTVPVGVTLVRVSGSVQLSSGAEFLSLRLRKNGLGFNGSPQKDNASTANNAVQQIMSGPLEVVGGDYFELWGQTSGATNAASSLHTWFQIEEVAQPAGYQRCLAYRTASQALSAGVWTAVQLNNELYDTASMHDNASNNTRIVVPSGVTQARVSFNAWGDNQTSSFYARVTKNGSPADGLPFDGGNNGGEELLHATGAWISVTPGEYFELECNSVSARNISTNCWLCVECK
jgi:hypothetical protein